MTEMITGLDIVAMQIAVAGGAILPITQADLRISGHAVECRVNAEDPDSFVPSPGRVGTIHVPGGPGIRVDTHVVDGSAIPASYDSMIAKVIVHGQDRAEAMARARAAMDEMQISGVASNIALHRALLSDPEFNAGGVSIHFLEKWLEKRGVGNE